MLAVGSARAGETETRDFAILVDGKRSGEYHLTIAKQDDGSTRVTAVADVRVSYFIKTYTYSYRGTEVWKGGRLQRLDSSSNDNGKQFQVTAVPDGDQLFVTVNGRTHGTRADAWTTTYWHLADARFHNQGVPLLDADTGKDLRGALRYVDTSVVQINGEEKQCAHWSVNGDVTADLWYDAQGRLVRQESIEDGYRTIFLLLGIHR